MEPPRYPNGAPPCPKPLSRKNVPVRENLPTCVRLVHTEKTKRIRPKSSRLGLRIQSTWKHRSKISRMRKSNQKRKQSGIESALDVSTLRAELARKGWRDWR